MSGYRLWLGAMLLLPASLALGAGDDWLKGERLEVRFLPDGRPAEVRICHPDCGGENVRQERLSSDQGLLDLGLPADLLWEQEPTADGQVGQRRFSAGEGIELRWVIAADGYTLALQTRGVGQIRMTPGSEFQPRPAAGFGEWLEQIRYLSLHPRGVEVIALDEASGQTVRADWAGVRSRFWAFLASTEQATDFVLQMDTTSQAPTLSAGNSVDGQSWLFYLGPVERGELGRVDELLPQMMYAGLWFWLRWICIFLDLLLGMLFSLIPVWGLAVMALSVCVGALMLPLTRAADRLQNQVHAIDARLAPELGRIKREFRGEEQAAKIIALYKTERVHPLYSLKSLLGVAIVIPVFIGAFDMLAENIHLMNTSFLWIEDLSRPDRLLALPLGIDLPFFGAYLNLLPLLMTGLSLLASGLHNPPALDPGLRRRQLRNMVLLALAFFVLFYTFPAGMVLYWTTNNLISVGKGLTSRWSNREHMTDVAN